MNQFAPITPPTNLPATVASGGADASMRFLDSSRQHPQPAHAPSLCPRRGGIARLVIRCRRAVDQRCAAGARRNVYRGRNARGRRTSVKQRLATIRHLFDWHVPAKSCRSNRPLRCVGPARRDVGQTPVLDPAEARALRLCERGGKRHAMPCHHNPATASSGTRNPVARRRPPLPCRDPSPLERRLRRRRASARACIARECPSRSTSPRHRHAAHRCRQPPRSYQRSQPPRASRRNAGPWVETGRNPCLTLIVAGASIDAGTLLSFENPDRPSLLSWLPPLHVFCLWRAFGLKHLLRSWGRSLATHLSRDVEGG
jgi:hypothetical protein